MSFNEEDDTQGFHRGKRRRVQRACDACRRRKTRCDGSQMPGDECTICIEAKIECTYLEAAPKRSPPQSYIESLEKRLAESEALVRELRAELAAIRASSSFLKLSTDPANDERPQDAAGSVRPTERTAVFLFFMRTALRNLAAPQPPPHGDDLVHLDLARRLQKLNVGPPSGRRRFVGKSSGVMLLNVAMNLKERVKREESEVALGHGDADNPVEDQSDKNRVSWSTRRLRSRPYKPNTEPRVPTYRLPSEARMTELIEQYFTHQNIYLPLLHRPTFERNIADGLHLRNDGFAVTVLLVCAIGSRWDTDPGVADHARGWEWFDQVGQVKSQLYMQASLYDIQYYSLAVQFLDGSSAPQACWNLVGIGLRAAQDIGCHRRTAQVEVPSVERELYKRAFWVLVYQDRVISSNMGRTCAVQYEDFDVDLPIECDDEYWEHPTHPFQQPAGLPSRVTFFNTLTRLHHILAFSLKILYGLSKVHLLFMQEDGWEDKAVAELDSALNNWHDQIPDHLRWDAARADPVFFDQSVSLYCAYHHLQVLIHRPFIPMIRKSAPTALPSLAICTSAARAVANMVDIQRRREGSAPFVVNLGTVFTSGLILLLNVWSGKRTGLLSDTRREMVNVHKCMEVISFCESRWQTAGTLWDILAELASVGQLPLPDVPLKGVGAEDNDTISPTEDAPSIQASRGSRQAFNRTIDNLQLRALCEPTPQPSSFVGALGDDTGSLGPMPLEPSAFAPTAAPEPWLASEDPYAQIDPAQASRELGDMMDFIDNDTIAMWSNAPMGLEVDDWGNYFSTFSELTRGQPGLTDMGIVGQPEQS
ncbi:fungal-specific transcription factor domain-containing protein [Mycena polygramma]|nr:fungal-specific transcription factor domain-containing protein [Mycena polygramma]